MTHSHKEASLAPGKKAAATSQTRTQKAPAPLIPQARMRSKREEEQEAGEMLMNQKENARPGSKVKVKQPAESGNLQPAGELWSSAERLFWDHMKEVQNKWDTLKLNDDIWAKLIYFEQNRRLAKAYVSAPVLTIDGSANGLDGFRIGLSGIDNTYRNLQSIRCLRSIGQGIKLKIDSQGNILIRKIGNAGGSQLMVSSNASGSVRQCSVWVRDWPSPGQSASLSQRDEQLTDANQQAAAAASVESGSTMREIEKSDISYKLFDMRKFRLQLERQRLNSDHTPIDWRQCVTIINFVKQPSTENDTSFKQTATNSENLLENPCWLMLINIIAIDMLKSSFCDRSISNNNINTNHRLNSSNNSNININNGNRSSSLIQQHSLLELHNDNKTNSQLQLKQRRPDLSSLNNANNAPLRTSSSASIINTSTGGALQNGGQHQASKQFSNYYNSSSSSSNRNSSGTESTQNLLISSSERVKKLRTANSRYRPNSLFRNNFIDEAQDTNGSQYLNNNYQRRYQSTQQLSTNQQESSNNAIYTTFNSKFLNSFSKSHADYSSASDYNSVSRSTSSGQQQNYWCRSRRYAPAFNQLEPLHKHHSNSLYPNETPTNHPQARSKLGFDLDYNEPDLAAELTDNADQQLREQARAMMFSPNPLFKAATAKNKLTFSTNRLEPAKRISLSAFELSHRRLDLRSSIKMNYDDTEEEEEEEEVEGGGLLLRPARDEDEFYRLDKENRSIASAVSEQKLSFPIVQQGRPYSAVGCEMGRRAKQPKAVPFYDADSRMLRPGADLEACDAQSVTAPSCCCDSNEINNLVTATKKKSPNNLQQQESVTINHNECRATKGVNGLAREAVGSAPQASRGNELSEQKVSRASIDSSSSSSGCVDNDYFMSHSSSSMSSSTASNEREMFSQPASSSGIICSAGSTSDEYDVDNGKQQPVEVASATKTGSSKNLNNFQHGKRNSASKIELSKSSDNQRVGRQHNHRHHHHHHQHHHQQQHHHHHHKGAFKEKTEPSTESNICLAAIRLQRRGYKIKTIEPVGDRCPASDLSTSKRFNGCLECGARTDMFAEPAQLADDCDCPLVDFGKLDECDCDCCTCDCDCSLSTPSPQSAIGSKLSLRKFDEQQANGGIVAAPDYEEDSIYSQLPHPKDLTAKGAKKSELDVGGKKSALMKRSGSGIKLGSDRAVNGDFGGSLSELSKERQSSKSATIETKSAPNTTKELKHTSSWIERHRYSKIFPKFIFSSSSATRHQVNTQRDLKNGNMQRKSNTLERDGKFRLIKSTQDL